MRIVSTHDLGAKSGKSALWHLLATLRPTQQPEGFRTRTEYRSLCELYRCSGLSIGAAVRLAALDFAERMPEAELLDPDIIDELRGPFSRLELEPQEV